MKYFLSLLLVGQIAFAQERMKPEETEVWEPEPQVIQPGIFTAPPSDAIVLFDGTDLSKWRSERNKEAATWTINPDKSMTVKPRSGGIETRDEHGSIQLHIEWKSPTEIKG